MAGEGGFRGLFEWSGLRGATCEGFASLFTAITLSVVVGGGGATGSGGGTSNGIALAKDGGNGSGFTPAFAGNGKLAEGALLLFFWTRSLSASFPRRLRSVSASFVNSVSSLSRLFCDGAGITFFFRNSARSVCDIVMSEVPMYDCDMPLPCK